MGRWSEGNSPNGAGNPFITPVSAGFASSTLLNPYIAAIGGTLSGDEKQEMAQKIGSGDGFGSGSGQYHVQPVSGAFSDSYTWSASGKVDREADPSMIPQSDGRDGGVKPFCYKQG